MKTVKNTLIRMLLCCMAAVLALTSAFAAETAPDAQPERIRLLAVQGAGNTGAPAELLAALAVVPALDFDYAAYYDDGHFSLCDLSAAQTYSDRGAAFDAWAAQVSKARVRNASHDTLWDSVAAMDADLSLLDVVWIPQTDLLPEQWEDVSAAISLVTASGGSVRIYAGAQAAVLSANADALINVEVLPVTDARVDVADSLLGEAGYYHHTTEAIVNVLRTAEVHPADTLPGDTVLIDWCPDYKIVGNTYSYLGVSVGVADTSTGMAVSYDAVPVAGAEEDVRPEASLPLNEPVMELSSESGASEDGIDAAFAAIAQQHQLCWYFKPASDPGVLASVDPAVVPYSVEPQVTFTLKLAPAAEHALAQQLCTENLLDEEGRFLLSAVLRDAEGAETVLDLQPAAQAGEYAFTIDRAVGQFTVCASLSLTDLPYSYPAIVTPITMEAPVQVEAKQNVQPISLAVSPLLWHGGETEITLSLQDYFTGSYLPVVCKNSDEQLVQTAISGDTLQLTALKEGKTQLFLLSRDGATGVLVPVEITNGQTLVLIEAGAALLLIALVLYSVLFARSKQPRFRKGEQLSVAIDGSVSFTLPVRSYGASGVTLWRLLVVSGRAAEYKPESASFKRIAVLPKRDRIIVKNDKSVESLITGQPAMLQCGSHSVSITLEATRPEA